MLDRTIVSDSIIGSGSSSNWAGASGQAASNSTALHPGRAGCLYRIGRSRQRSHRKAEPLQGLGARRADFKGDEPVHARA